jgi:hypothetical protein
MQHIIAISLLIMLHSRIHSSKQLNYYVEGINPLPWNNWNKPATHPDISNPRAG